MRHHETGRARPARWGAAGVAVFGAGAVVMGALGAHALHATMSAESIATWNTAVRFQFWHVLGLAVAVAVRGGHFGGGEHGDRIAILALETCAAGFALGIVLFCGSLYALALGAPRAVGFVTPLGGLCFVAAWIALGVALARAVADRLG
jgi:uncharacterized membrane protein YgdD (TMEM256/DUF423 family)